MPLTAHLKLLLGVLLVAFAPCLLLGDDETKETPAKEATASEGKATHDDGHAKDEGHAKGGSDHEHDDHGNGHDDEHHAPHLTDAGATVADPADPKEDMAIYTFIVFLLLLGVLYKFAWPKIAAGLDAREKSIADNIANAEKLHQDALDRIAEYEKKLHDSQEEVREIIEEARRDADVMRQEMVVKANEEIQGIRDQASKEVATAKSQAIKELAQFTTDLSIELSSKLIGAQLNKEDHSALIDRQLDEALSKFKEYSPSTN